MSYYSWEILYEGMLPLLKARIDAHNDALPDDLPRNDRRFCKRTEKHTLYTLAQDWCRQAAARIREGKPVTNVVETNNPMSQAYMGCADTAIAHRRKLTWLGFLLGHRADKIEDCRAAQDWHGTRANYFLLLDPTLIPKGCIPQQIPFVSVDNFVAPGPATPPAPLAPPDKVEKTDLIISKTESLEINQLSKAAAEPEAEAVRSYVAGLFSDDASVSRAQCEDPAGPEDGKRERVVPPAQRSMTEKGAAPALDVYARLLVEMYVTKLSANRAWVTGELERGVDSARHLLTAWMQRVDYPPGLDVRIWERMALMAARDRAVKVIDHMAEAMRRNPKLYCLPPSIWLLPSSPAGITGAENRYLKPYEQQATAWQDLARIRMAADAAAAKSDTEVAAKAGDAGLIALTLKRKLMALHPGDNRLRSADLSKWAFQIDQAARRDRHGFDRVAAAVRWMCDSTDEQAKFWRADAGGQGIRSAGGLRRALPHIFNAMAPAPTSKPARK